MNKFQLLIATKKLLSVTQKKAKEIIKQADSVKKESKIAARQLFLEKKEAGIRTSGKHVRFERYKHAGMKYSHF